MAGFTIFLPFEQIPKVKNQVYEVSLNNSFTAKGREVILPTFLMLLLVMITYVNI